MIFLDIEVPDYQAMRTQEHKVPNLIKTLRGKGTLENSNEFDVEDRLHLSFTVTEENLKKFLKVYSRFQTMCLIPMFDESLKHKIYDSYLEYKKNVLKAFLKSVGDNNKEYDDIVNSQYNSNPKFTAVIKSIVKNNFEVMPNANDCMMVFLESFSFNSIQDSSNSYNLDMILWVCNDLTFYNGDEINFLEKYYEKFASKKEAFKRVDEEIENLFIQDKKISDLNLSFSNIYNDQEVYSRGKQFEQVAAPTGINIPNKYITQIEIRAMNNLKRMPIVGKSKGFIQHMGKGEIGITVKMVFNQKNALDEKIIHDIKSLSLYQQEYITMSESDFYLIKGMDIKELSLSTNIIEEPTEDVDTTVVTLFFTGAGTNKKEIENNYFNIMERESNKVMIKLFNRYLDLILDKKHIYKLVDDDIHIENVDRENYGYKLFEFAKTIISKNDKTDASYQNVQGENVESVDRDFMYRDLFNSYNQSAITKYIENINKGNPVDDELIDINLKCTRKNWKIFDFIKELIVFNDIPKDSYYSDDVLFRIQQLAFKMLTSYQKNMSPEERNVIYEKIRYVDNKSQNKFVSDKFVYFLAEFFKLEFLTDVRKMNIFAISNVFKIEILNNAVTIIKNILDKDFVKKDPVFNKATINLIDDNGRFDPSIKGVIRNSVLIAFNSLREILPTDEFKFKVLDFISTNYYLKTVISSDMRGALEKSVKQEIDMFIERYDNFVKSLNSDNDYYFELVELLTKLNVMGSRAANIKGKENSVQVYSITEDTFSFNNIETKSLLISNVIMSMFMADLNYEDSVYGVIAIESSKNIIGPHVVTYTSLDYTLGEITGNLKSKLNGKTDLNEYVEGLEDENDKVDVLEYKDILDKLETIKKIYEMTFGRENLQYLLKLNKTFVRTSLENQDFNSAHGQKVFESFETPMSFLKAISESTDKYKETYMRVNEDISKYTQIAEETNLESITNSENADESINKTHSKVVSEMLDKSNTVFSSVTKIADLTINKNKPGDVQPSTFMQTELLGELKVLRGLNNASKLVLSQYEKAMPNYEIYVIDEEYVKKAIGRGYDYSDKIYSISNVVSINIKHEDVTNLKFAVIKIMNTVPHYVGLNTIFNEGSIFADSNKQTKVVYGNKFTTEKIVFRSGMLINVSLDKESQFFDFNGKIDSVEIANDLITLKCSSFASELLAETFDLDNVSATGIWSNIAHNKIGFFRKLKKGGQVTSNSKLKLDYINGHLIPEDFINGGVDDAEGYKSVLGGASGILCSSLDKSLATLKHLDCPYNDLIIGKSLAENKDNAIGGVINDIAKTAGYVPSSTTSHRIRENVNAVEFDTSFYGAQVVKGSKDSFEATNVSKDKNEGKIILGHSSFVPEFINNEFFDRRYENSSQEGFKDEKPAHKGSLLGYCYSYRRKGIKLYDVLNDLTLRNPAAYWDVLESGQYGTLFFGRNNYMVTRKNKVSSLSREDVDKISDLMFSCFKDESAFDKGYITGTEMAQCLRYLSELAAIYDSNFARDKDIVNKLKAKKLKEVRQGNTFFKDVSVINQHLYNEESPATDCIIAMSGYNLISCNIKTNEEYINTVDVTYKPGLGDRFDRFIDIIRGTSNKVRLKSFETLPEDRVRAIAVDPSLTTDLHTETQAFEYAQSVMYKEFVNYYSGKIVILYCPSIKKNDEVVIIDSKNKITGTVIVRDFEHIVDVDSGAITIITPGMKVKTSSMMNDIYLTGIVSKIRYEYLKRFEADYPLEELDKVNQIATSKLRDVFGDVLENVQSIPMSYEYVGYNFKLDQKQFDETSKETSKIVVDGEKKNISTGKIELKIEEGSIITPRNVSNLPFKIYPLVQNGKPLMPDYDIYNSVPKAFDFVTRMLVNVYYGLRNDLGIGMLCNDLMTGLSDLSEVLFITKDTPFREIVKNYFAAFAPNIQLSETDVRAFIDKMLADSYDKYQPLDEDNIVISHGLLNKESMVFFNCKALNQYEDERIRKIAKILCQFKIVNLVELDGRIESDGKVVGFEKGDFTVIKKLIDYMEKYNEKSIQKKFSNGKWTNKWTCLLSERLIDEPILNSETEDGKLFSYDDIGAVLINMPKEQAVNQINPNTQRIKISSSTDLNGGLKASRYILKYTLNLKARTDKSRKLNLPMTVFLFHNFYGKELGKESISYMVRSDLADDLFRIAKTEIANKGMTKNVLVMGDFNLVLRDEFMFRYDKTPSNAINEFYDVFTEADLYNAVRAYQTTTGNKLYDQILIPMQDRNIIDYANIFVYQRNFDKEYTEKDSTVSDHFPVYVTFKNLSLIDLTESTKL